MIPSIGFFHKQKGLGRGSGKLFADDVREIRRLLQRGIDYTEISKRFSVKPNTIRDIEMGRTWGSLQK